MKKRVNQRFSLRNLVPKQHKALSTVVTSLIIILLVLVAVGIIWVVVRNVIETGTADIDVNVKCLEVDVRATAVVNTTADGETYDVTLTRKAGGDEIGGVKVVFFNDTRNSEVIDISEKIEPLQTVTKSSGDTDIPNANKVDVTVYFEVDGEDKLCKTVNSFSF